MNNSPFVGEVIPSLCYIGEMIKEPGQPFFTSLHHHPEHMELMLIAEGNVDIQIEGRWYAAIPGSLIIYNIGAWHQEKTLLSERCRILYFGVNGCQLPGLGADWLTADSNQYVYPLRDHYAGLELRFWDIFRYNNAGFVSSHWIASCLTAAFLAELLPLLGASATKLPGRRSKKRDIISVKQYIHEHYDENLSLDQLSKIDYISPFHLSRLFKSETGLSPIQYVIAYRLEAAKYYLMNTEDTIESIAERVGYQSETHFQNLFRRSTGMSPGQYRNKCR